MASSKRAGTPRRKGEGGKLKIGDDWNAITIIALSQTNPLKAIAEFVENSIDAHARTVSIIRGRERGEIFLRVVDDGDGIPRDDAGLPDFRYVATHICDSIKKRLKNEGILGIQGEFGIGLLSFWTIGERLVLSSGGADGRTWQMEMKKGEQGWSIAQRRSLFSHQGTELTVHPLLPGTRTLTGERIQHYLASELRDRIRKSGVKISVSDRLAKKQFDVVPRQFTGRHLPEIDAVTTDQGDIYFELYLNSHSLENVVSLFRQGTRVLPSIATLDRFNREPWTSGFLQGMIDAPFLQLTPGTRDGIVQDDSFGRFCAAVEGTEDHLRAIVARERESEEEEVSKNLLKAVQKALKEALLALPRDDYDWFEIPGAGRSAGLRLSVSALPDKERAGEDEETSVPAGAAVTAASGSEETTGEKRFFEYPGPLYQAVISPSSCIVRVRSERVLQCIPRDKSRRRVEQDISIEWSIREGGGALTGSGGEFVEFTAPDEPDLVMVEAVVRQGDLSCQAQCIITVADSLVEKENQDNKGTGKGIPGYTFIRAPGEIWRSRFDDKNNLVVINNGHKDYVFAAQKKARKLKYVSRLFAKELVLRNFTGFPAEQLLERMIELSMYMEENLRM
jgi:hypothetical protein